jgi:hypothetical protein
MELADDKPLPQEIFDGQIRQLGPGTVRQPHLRLVQPDQVDNDGKIAETEEFSAATQALGRGVTFFVPPLDEGAEAGKRGGTGGGPVSSHSFTTVQLIPNHLKTLWKSGEVGMTRFISAGDLPMTAKPSRGIRLQSLEASLHQDGSLSINLLTSTKDAQRGLFQGP